MGSVDNKVAFGMAFEREDMNNNTHRKPMQAGCLRVSMDGSIDGDALVPVPIPVELEKVHQAVGSHVAWPRDLIIFRTAMVCKLLSF